MKLNTTGLKSKILCLSLPLSLHIKEGLCIERTLIDMPVCRNNDGTGREEVE